MSLRVLLIALAGCLLLSSAPLITDRAQAADQPLLVLAKKIPLGNVKGRIDHLAIDLEHKRLFVAELGNDSVGVVDIAAARVMRTLTGLKEPQGVGYHADTGTLYAANAGDGSVRTFEGTELTAAGRIELGDDADNVRVDRHSPAVIVGYGKGGVAIIDPRTRQKTTEIRLAAHPESFQIDESSNRAFVNLPDAHQIAIVDLAAGKVARSIDTRDARSNFPMALDPAGGFMVVFRSPPRLTSYGPDGAQRASSEACGDADDVFVDSKRERVYVSCGAGFIDVFDHREGRLAKVAHIATVSGARTSLFAPELDRLYLAIRAQSQEPAAIWEFRPTP
jgi:DNA-binding beta-propeller fold protein YncE